MEMVVKNSVVEDIECHDGGEFSELIAKPIFSVIVVVSGEGVVTEEVTAADQSIPAMVDADGVGIEGFGSWFLGMAAAPIHGRP